MRRWLLAIGIFVAACSPVGRQPVAAGGVRWLLLALVLVLGAGLALLYLETQVGPILCTSSGNMGPPAPTPGAPGPCPSGFPRA